MILTYFMIVGLVFQFLAYVFQLHKIFLRKSTDDISLLTSIITLILTLLWTCYNFYLFFQIEDSSYLLPTISTTMSSSYIFTIIILKLIYDKERPKKPEILKKICIC